MKLFTLITFEAKRNKSLRSGIAGPYLFEKREHAIHYLYQQIIDRIVGDHSEDYLQAFDIRLPHDHFSIPKSHLRAYLNKQDIVQQLTTCDWFYTFLNQQNNFEAFYRISEHEPEFIMTKCDPYDSSTQVDHTSSKLRLD
ncbi:MAG: hypothetical protein OEZ58_17675 [Gammaproteobacteria bacterium]|nr:hypothetical protein [Gammaproteobacteria bacterium]